MIARATIAEIDFVRMSLEEATELFRESVVAALREQDGYEGALVLVSPQGQALALTLWGRGDAYGAPLEIEGDAGALATALASRLTP